MFARVLAAWRDPGHLKLGPRARLIALQRPRISRTGRRTSIPRLETRCAKSSAKRWTCSLACLLEALHFNDLGDQHVIGLTDGLSGHVRRPRKPPIRDRVQRPADDVAVLRHQTLKVLGQLRRTQLKSHEKGRRRTHPRGVERRRWRRAALLVSHATPQSRRPGWRVSPKRKSGDHQLETAVLALAADDPIGVHDLHSTCLSLAPAPVPFRVYGRSRARTVPTVFGV
jgi:hypothetical protein